MSSSEADWQERVARLARMVRHPDPSQLFYQVAEIGGDQTYLRHGVKLEPGDVVLDAGANFGVAAVFFAAFCGAAQVHCFEPVRPICAILRENVRSLPACVIYELGLWSAPRRSSITYYPGAAAMSGLYADSSRDQELVRSVLLNTGVSALEAEQQVTGRYEPQELACDLTTISVFMSEQQIPAIDLLKIDVERSERDVLAGITAADWPKIRQIVIEVHDENGHARQIGEELEIHGFRIHLDQERAMRGTNVKMLYATRG